MTDHRREAVEDYKNDMQSALWDYGQLIAGALDEIEKLQTACTEWAEVSQSNFQRAKLYRETLEKIAAPTYGLQSIHESHEHDTIEYYHELSEYYRSRAYEYQKLARDAINNEVEPVKAKYNFYVELMQVYKALSDGQESLGPDFEKAWSDNVEKLYEN